MKQRSLFAETQLFETVVISRRKEFEALFDGFTKLRVISYVVSPDLLLEFFDKRGYTEVEVIVGENLSAAYRQGLEQKGVEVTERLAERVESGTLRIFVPDRTIHSKLYILEGAGLIRVILSSANLTETARKAIRQTNYAWYADLPADHPWLRQVINDYKTHLQVCTPFMGDLIELFRQHQDVAKRQLIEAWLKGGVADEADLETKRVLQEIALHSLEYSNSHEEPVITVQLPEAPQARKQIDRLLEPLKPLKTKNEVHVNGPTFIRYVQENHGVPLMRVDLVRQEVMLGINGSVNTCTEPLADASSVNKALEHIETYLHTVDWGQSADPQFAKTSMFEALLYVFSAPFANEHMKIMRSRYGLLDTRGPKFLYIFGPSQNGKTTFLRFALKLLTGHHIQPFSGGDFTKRKIVGATFIGTAFPLVFDDVVPSQRGSFEEVLKSYWEIWWREEYVSPEIIMSSNAASLRDWAKSRVKRVDFDVHFAPSERNKERLADIFAWENPIFMWFSYLYLRHLESPQSPSDDELQFARVVMKELYEHAKRPLPGFFPHEPIEKLYDPGRRAWRDLLYRLRKASVRSEKDRVSVEFSQDMQHYEVKEYEGYLPQTVKYRRRGKTLIIESPHEFKKWLEGERAARRSWLSRLFRK